MKKHSPIHLINCTVEFLKKLTTLYESGSISLSLFEECSRIKIIFLEQQLAYDLRSQNHSLPIEEVLKKCYRILTPGCSIQ